ncbi:MAG: site-2 protease family protein [Armatimonadota bacterium]
MFENFDILRLVISMAVFIPAIALHEFCHAKFADLAGDMTPRSQGRVTLNPLAHLDPLGTIMMALSSLTGFGIGWGKPVMVNVGKMKNPRWDHFVSVVMGPVSNLCIALVCAILIKSGIVSAQSLRDVLANGGSIDTHVAFSSLGHFFAAYVVMSLIVNLGLFFFNLIPIGPLDGHWLVGAMLPPIQRNQWYKFCHGPGMLIFLALIFIKTDNFNPIGDYMGYTIGHALNFMLGGGI